MCTTSKNSVDSLKKKKVQVALKIFLTELFATYICITRYCPYYISPACIIVDNTTLSTQETF